MPDEQLSDAARVLILKLLLAATPEAERPSATMLEAIRKVAGTDTVLIARRTYRSREAANDGDDAQ